MGSSSLTARRSARGASPTYETHDLGQELARATPDDDLGQVVERRRLRVDDDHPGPGANGGKRDLRGGVDNQRRAHHQHHVGIAREREGLLYGRLRHRLTEKYDRRLEKDAAT